jgi:hypothetical protein
METRASANKQTDAGSVALSIIVITLFVVLVSCGCFFAPRVALTGSCGSWNSGGATQWRDAWRKMVASMQMPNMEGPTAHEPDHDQDGVQGVVGGGTETMHPIASAYGQVFASRGDEAYSTLRHPVGTLQPNLSPSTMSMTSSKPTQNAGFGN